MILLVMMMMMLVASPSDNSKASGKSSIVRGLRKAGEGSAQHPCRVCRIIMHAALPAAQTWQEEEKPAPVTTVVLSATRILITRTLVIIMRIGAHNHNS